MRIGTLGTVLLGLLLAFPTAIASAQNSKPAIFVGPQIRDGFVDIDAGVRDSINDIKQEFQ